MSGALLAYGFFKIKGLISRFFKLDYNFGNNKPQNPQRREEKQSDIAVVLVDKTSSQSLEIGSFRLKKP